VVPSTTNETFELLSGTVPSPLAVAAALGVLSAAVPLPAAVLPAAVLPAGPQAASPAHAATAAPREITVLSVRIDSSSL
jgi:hypothetical protein